MTITSASNSWVSLSSQVNFSKITQVDSLPIAISIEPLPIEAVPTTPGGASPAVVAAQPPRRSAWVDHARGLGIILVVFGHALRGMHDAGLYDGASAWANAEYLLSTTRMPLFFALTGLFVVTRLQRLGAPAFARTGLERIGWPYVLWTALTSLALTVAGDLANKPGAFSLGGFVYGLLVPSGVFWFLQALLIWHVLSALLVPRVGAIGVLAVALLALGLPQTYPAIPYGVQGACRFGVFYAIGMLYGGGDLRRDGLGRDHLPIRALILCLPALTVVWLAVAHQARVVGVIGETGTGTGMGWGGPASLPAAMLGVLLAAICCAALPDRWGGWLADVGRHSLAILVMHVMFTAATRIVFVRGMGLGADYLAPLVGAATLVGVLGPLAVKHLTDRRQLSGWLGLR